MRIAAPRLGMMLFAIFLALAGCGGGSSKPKQYTPAEAAKAAHLELSAAGTNAGTVTTGACRAFMLTGAKTIANGAHGQGLRWTRIYNASKTVEIAVPLDSSYCAPTFRKALNRVP